MISLENCTEKKVVHYSNILTLEPNNQVVWVLFESGNITSQAVLA